MSFPVAIAKREESRREKTLFFRQSRRMRPNLPLSPTLLCYHIVHPTRICPEGELKGGKGKRLILASTEDLHARISALEGALRELTKNTPEGTHPLLESSFHYEPLDTDDKSVKSLSARTKSTKGQKRLDEDDSEVEIVQPGTKGKDKARDVDGPSNQETHGGNDSGNSSSREKGEGREVKVKLEGIGKNMVLDDNDDDAGANIMAKAPLSDIAPVEASFGQLTMGDEPGHSRYFGSGSASAYLLVRYTTHFLMRHHAG